MMKTLLLISALGTPQADCSIATAEAVIQGPDATSLISAACTAKRTSPTVPSPVIWTGRHYLKITCTSGEPLHAVPDAPIRSTAQATD